MTDFTILHCADLHLDSPLRGLEADPDAPVAAIRGATRQALTNLVDFAIDRRVAVVLIAGDIYDGPWRDVRTGLFFVEVLTRLTQAGIHVVAVSGNHDAESVITGKLQWPTKATMLRSDRAETFPIPELKLHIHGRSFATPDPPGRFLRSFPPRIEGELNIGLLHTSATGFDKHARYAPCTPEDMAALGYQYWALGHIHKRRELCKDPWIVFPGNLQGRDIGETGEKGATLITVRNGSITDVAHHTLDAVRWANVEPDASGAANEDAAHAIIQRYLADAVAKAAPRLVAARVRVHGVTAAHASLVRDHGATAERIRSEALASNSGMLWLEGVRIETRPVVARAPATEMERLLQWEINAAPPDTLRAMIQEWASLLLEKCQPLKKELPEDHPIVTIAFGNPDIIERGMLEEARSLLLAQLDAYQDTLL